MRSRSAGKKHATTRPTSTSDRGLSSCTARTALSNNNKKGAEAPSAKLARPERFELPTTKFVAWYSIQLSYGREEAELFRHNVLTSTPNRSGFLFCLLMGTEERR